MQKRGVQPLPFFDDIHEGLDAELANAGGLLSGSSVQTTVAAYLSVRVTGSSSAILNPLPNKTLILQLHPPKPSAMIQIILEIDGHTGTNHELLNIPSLEDELAASCASTSSSATMQPTPRESPKAGKKPT